MLRNIGKYEENIDSITKSLTLKLGIIYNHESYLRFKLSDYNGVLDILYDVPSAMHDFNPQDSQYINLSEITEKQRKIKKIIRKYNFQIKATKYKKLHIAKVKSIKIINFLFRNEKEIFIGLQTVKNEISKDIKRLANNLRGAKSHSNLIKIPNPYEDIAEESENYFRIFFRHSFSNIQLKSLIRKKIYNKFSGELYFISTTTPTIIANIYDDRGVDIVGSNKILKEVMQEFKDKKKSISLSNEELDMLHQAKDSENIKFLYDTCKMSNSKFEIIALESAFFELRGCCEDYLTKVGFDEHYNTSKEGIILEHLIDKIHQELKE